MILFCVRSPLDPPGRAEPARGHVGIRLGTEQELLVPDTRLWDLDGACFVPVALAILQTPAAPGFTRWRSAEFTHFEVEAALAAADRLVVPNSPPTAARTRREIARYAAGEVARAVASAGGNTAHRCDPASRSADPAWLLPGGAVLVAAQAPSRANGGRLVLALGGCPERWDQAEVEMPRAPWHLDDPDTERYAFAGLAGRPGLDRALWTGRCSVGHRIGAYSVSDRAKVALVSQNGPAVIIDGVSPAAPVRLCNNMLPLAEVALGEVHARVHIAGAGSTGNAGAGSTGNAGAGSTSYAGDVGDVGDGYGAVGRGFASAELIVPLPGEPLPSELLPARGRKSERILSFPGGATAQGSEKQWAGEVWVVGDGFFPRICPRETPVITYAGDQARPAAVRYVPQDRAWAEFRR
jgi:hypothetical protein